MSDEWLKELGRPARILPDDSGDDWMKDLGRPVRVLDEPAAQPEFERGIPGEVTTGLARGTLGILDSVAGLGRMAPDVVLPGSGIADRMIGWATGTRPSEQIFGTLSKGLRSAQQSDTLRASDKANVDTDEQPFYTNPSWYASAIPEAIPQLAAQIALAAATGGTSTASQVGTFAAIGGGQAAGSTYNDSFDRLRKRGYSESESANRAGAESAVVGAFTAAIELVPGAVYASKNPATKKFFQSALANSIKSATEKNLGTKIASGFAAEGASEAIEEAVGATAQWAAENDPEAFKGLGRQMFKAGVTGGILGGGAKALQGNQQDEKRTDATAGVETAQPADPGLSIDNPPRQFTPQELQTPEGVAEWAAADTKRFQAARSAVHPVDGHPEIQTIPPEDFEQLTGVAGNRTVRNQFAELVQRLAPPLALEEDSLALPPNMETDPTVLTRPAVPPSDWSSSNVSIVEPSSPLANPEPPPLINSEIPPAAANSRAESLPAAAEIPPVQPPASPATEPAVTSPPLSKGLLDPAAIEARDRRSGKRKKGAPPRTPAGDQAIAEAAIANEVDVVDLHAAVDDLWQQKREKVEARREAIEEVRMQLGSGGGKMVLSAEGMKNFRKGRRKFSAQDARKIEDSGKDYSEIDGFDQATEWAINNGLEVRNGDDLWNLLREDDPQVPPRHDPDLIREAVDMVDVKAKNEKPVTKEAVQRLAPGAKIHDVENGWITEYAGGDWIRIEKVQGIKIPQKAIDAIGLRGNERLFSLDRKQKIAVKAAGAFRMSSSDKHRQLNGFGLLELAAGRGWQVGTLVHELLHFARRSGKITPLEWKALLERHATDAKMAEWYKANPQYKRAADGSIPDLHREEAVADARTEWNGTRSVFNRLRAWIKQLLHAIGIDSNLLGKLTAEDVHTLMDSAEFWARMGDEKIQGQFTKQPAYKLGRRGDGGPWFSEDSETIYVPDDIAAEGADLAVEVDNAQRGLEMVERDWLQGNPKYWGQYSLKDDVRVPGRTIKDAIADAEAEVAVARKDAGEFKRKHGISVDDAYEAWNGHRLNGRPEKDGKAAPTFRRESVAADDEEEHGSTVYSVRPDARPDLSQLTETPEARKFVEDADVARGKPKGRTDDELYNDATQEAAAELPSYAGWQGVTKLIAKYQSNERITAADFVITKAVVEREIANATDPEKFKELAVLHDEWRRHGTRLSEEFRIRQDRVETPAQRYGKNKRTVFQAIAAPPEHIQEQLDKLKDQLAAEMKKRVDMATYENQETQSQRERADRWEERAKKAEAAFDEAGFLSPEQHEEIDDLLDTLEEQFASSEGVDDGGEVAFKLSAAQQTKLEQAEAKLARAERLASANLNADQRAKLDAAIKGLRKEVNGFKKLDAEAEKPTGERQGSFIESKSPPTETPAAPSKGKPLGPMPEFTGGKKIQGSGLPNQPVGPAPAPSGKRSQKELDLLEQIKKIEGKWITEAAVIPTQLKALGFDLNDPKLFEDWTRTQQMLTAASALRIKAMGPAARASAVLNEYWRASILSGFKTIVANASGLGWGAYKFGVEMPTEAVMNLFLKDPQRATFGSTKAAWKALAPGMVEGARGFLLTWKARASFFDHWHGITQDNMDSLNKAAIGGKLGTIINAGLTTNMAVDDFAKTLFARMQVAETAHRMAAKEGKTGKAFDKRVEFLQANLESDAWKEAIKTARELTFQQEGGKVAKGVKEGFLKIRKAVPGSQFVIPFITVPVNIAETAVKHSLLGTMTYAAQTAYKIASGDIKNITAPEARHVLALATFLAILGMNDEDDPWMTGTFNMKDPAVRAMVERTGRKPQSIKVGGKWVSYARIEPFATMWATLVDFSNALKSGGPIEGGATAIRGLGNQLSDKTMLSGLADAHDALTSDEGHKAERWAGNFARSWVPNVYRQAMTASRDQIAERAIWEHETADFGTRTMQGTELPFTQADLPKVTQWGKPVKASEGPVPGTDFLWRALMPVEIVKEDIDELDRALMNWNRDNEDDPRKLIPPIKTWTDTQGRKQMMNNEQWNQFLTLSGQVAHDLATLANVNADKPSKSDVDAIGDAVREARTAAKKALAAEWSGKGKAPSVEELTVELADARLGSVTSAMTDPAPERRAGEKLDEFKVRKAKHQEQVEEARLTLNRMGLERKDLAAALRKATKKRGNNTNPTLDNGEPSAFGRRLQRLSLASK